MTDDKKKTEGLPEATDKASVPALSTPDGGKEAGPLAKSLGKVAEKILEVARRQKIPIRFDADMSSILSALNLEDDIPRELYRALAEILSILYLAERENRCRVKKNV